MTRNILSAVVVALVAVIALFVVNLGATSISPERYRKVVLDAVQDGTMTRTLRQPFAPRREITPINNSECLILVMLVTERDSCVKASISPRMMIQSEHTDLPLIPGYGPDLVCRILGGTMLHQAGTPVPFLEPGNHHRYLHAGLTLATFVLALVPLHVAGWILLFACYAALAVLALAAALRMRGAPPAERRRAAAFLVMAGVLAAFYALPVFGSTFAHAPTDIAIVAFMLVGLLHPLCRMPERRFALVVAAFGTAIAAFELLTGGMPTGLAVLIALIALGEAPDVATVRRRLLVGVVCYGVAIITGFAAKLLAIMAVWGPGEFTAMVKLVSSRMVSNISNWPALESWLARFGFAPDAMNKGTMRHMLALALVTYSAFVLGWGSHVLGALIVIVPVPLLMVLTWVALRRVPRAQWLVRPQPLLLAAACVPFAWYLALEGHTFTHSFFMVRPVALNVAFAAIAAMMLPRQPAEGTASARPGTMVRDAASPAS
jgi:hypothetical protein